MEPWQSLGHGCGDPDERAPDRAERQAVSAAESAAELEILKQLFDELQVQSARQQKRLVALDPSVLRQRNCVDAFAEGFQSGEHGAAPGLGFTDADKLSDRDIALVKEALNDLRQNGRTACVPARPEMVEYTCNMLRRLLKANVITHAESNPLRGLAEPQSLVAALEDWQPHVSGGMETLDTISNVSPETGVTGVAPGPRRTYGSFMMVRPGGGEPRVSCSGAHALATFFECTGTKLHHLLSDVVIGYNCRRAGGEIDLLIGAHNHPPPYTTLVRSYFGPLIFHLVLEQPRYRIVLLKSAIVRDEAKLWLKAQGGRARKLTEEDWLFVAGVSNTSASESAKNDAYFVWLPWRDAMPEEEWLPPRPARDEMTQIWITQQQGSMNSCMGATSGAQRSHEQAQLPRGLIASDVAPLDKNLYTSASPLSWVVQPHGPSQMRKEFDLLWLLSHQVAAANWHELAAHEANGTQPPAALQAWADEARANMSAAQNNPMSTTTTQALWAAITELEEAGDELTPELAAWKGRTAAGKWHELAVHEANGTQPPAALQAWADEARANMKGRTNKTTTAAWATPEDQRDAKQVAAVKGQSRRLDPNADNITQAQIKQQAAHDEQQKRYLDESVQLKAILGGSEGETKLREIATTMKAELEGNGKGRKLLKRDVMRHLGGGSSGSQWCRDRKLVAVWSSTFEQLGIRVNLSVTDPKPLSRRSKRARTATGEATETEEANKSGDGTAMETENGMEE